MVILTATDGEIELKDQLRDYKFRGEELVHMNFLNFMLDTYESSTKLNEDNEPFQNTTDETYQPRGPGRPLSARIPYQDEAGKTKCCRIARLKGHETLPRFVGKWFSRNDDDIEKDLHRASMLMLLKPWRNLHQLKTPTETFGEAYDHFISQTDHKTLTVISNIQYFHECSDGAKADREKSTENGHLHHAETDSNNHTENNMIIDNIGEMELLQDRIQLEEITEDDIERARLMKTHARERLHGENAVNLGYDAGFFEETDQDITYTSMARRMEADEGENIRRWETQLKNTTRDQMNEFGTINISTQTNEINAAIQNRAETAGTRPEVTAQTETMTQVDEIRQGHPGRSHLSNLNEEQRRAHDIIEEKLIQHIKGKSIVNDPPKPIFIYNPAR